MGIKELEFTIENIGHLVDLRLKSLRQGTVHPKHVLDVCLLYRRMGCGMLLANYDSEGFFYLLYQAADAYLQLLERKQHGPEMDAYYLARARAEPLLDALALGDWELARRIHAQAETRYQAGLEYEEDFGALMLLPQLAQRETPREELLRMLERIEQVLEGAEYARHELLKALLDGDAEAFEGALLKSIDAWQARMERERKSGTGNPIALATDANVFVEGIAFVRVARLRGLRTRGQYPLIPPIALSDAPLGLERRRIW